MTATSLFSLAASIAIAIAITMNVLHGTSAFISTPSKPYPSQQNDVLCPRRNDHHQIYQINIGRRFSVSLPAEIGIHDKNYDNNNNNENNSNNDNNNNEESNLIEDKYSNTPSPPEELSKIRYLGSGPDAIVRPGVVLVAPHHEYDHFLMKSAVFVYAIGLNEVQETVVRGVIIDHPTAFTVGEMSPNIMGTLSNNLLFRGGRYGRDTAMLLHSAGGPDGPIQSTASTPSAQSTSEPPKSMIGSSGIYEGGIVSAMESVDAGIVSPERCKFFFNYMEFREQELEDMFAGVVAEESNAGDVEGGAADWKMDGAEGEEEDAWVSLEIPPEYVLNSDLERGEMWSRLRNYVRQIQMR